LQENGWCVDWLEIHQSTIPGAGRGAFVTRSAPKGTVVAPVPLQIFKDRRMFQESDVELLYVNYCLQPKDSNMIFFPYGPGVNLINHSSEKPNAYLRWSKNHMHQSEQVDLSIQDLMKESWPGSMILEVVALRDLAPGEELFMNYGSDWEEAWNAHVQRWTPVDDAESYVYPQDMDDTAPLRTVEE
jgi:hypothetical protein